MRPRRSQARRATPALGQLYHSLNDLLGIDLVAYHESVSPRTLGDAIDQMRMGSAYDTAMYSEVVERHLQRRAAAKDAKDYALADAIRDGLTQAGVIVKDTSSGATVEFSPDFVPEKLEAMG